MQNVFTLNPPPRVIAKFVQHSSCRNVPSVAGNDMKGMHLASHQRIVDICSNRRGNEVGHAICGNCKKVRQFRPVIATATLTMIASRFAQYLGCAIGEDRVCQISRQRSKRLPEQLGRVGLRWLLSPAATALWSPQIVEGNLCGLSNKSSVPGLPTPRKAEVHEALEGLVNVPSRGNCRVDHHTRGDNDFSLDPFLVLVGKSYAIQSDCRRRCWDRIVGWKCPAHDFGFYGPFDFLDKLRVDVEIFEGSWHRLPLSKPSSVFQFVIAAT